MRRWRCGSVNEGGAIHPLSLKKRNPTDGWEGNTGWGMPLAYIHAFAYFFFQWGEDAVFIEEMWGIEEVGWRAGGIQRSPARTAVREKIRVNILTRVTPPWRQIQTECRHDIKYGITKSEQVSCRYFKGHSEDITWPKINASQRVMWQTCIGVLEGLKHLTAFIPCRVACARISVPESLLALRNLSIRTWRHSYLTSLWGPLQMFWEMRSERSGSSLHCKCWIQALSKEHFLSNKQSITLPRLIYYEVRTNCGEG